MRSSRLRALSSGDLFSYMSVLGHLATESDLEERLSAPNDADVACCRRLGGDVLVLGAAGKIGPSLVRRIVNDVDANFEGRRRDA